MAPAFHIQKSKVDEVMTNIVTNQDLTKSQVTSATNSDQSSSQALALNNSGLTMAYSADFNQNSLPSEKIEEIDVMMKDTILDEIIGKKKHND